MRRNVIQSRRSSLIEVVVSTAIGFGVALVTTIMILPLFGFDATPGQSVQITSIYTVVSIVRGYGVRRFFNRSVVFEGRDGVTHYHVDSRGVSVYKSGVPVARIDMTRDQLVGLAADALSASREIPTDT